VEEHVPLGCDYFEYGAALHNPLRAFFYGECCSCLVVEKRPIYVRVDIVCDHAFELDGVEGRPGDKRTCSCYRRSLEVHHGTLFGIYNVSSIRLN
jgi:hypothetical protein